MRIHFKKRVLNRLTAYAMTSVVAIGFAASAAARDYAIWSFSKTMTTDAWTSRRTDDLSEWKIVDCLSFGPQFLLTGLTGHKEPWGNLDNFIARLDATCTEFDRKSTHTVRLFTSKNHRDTPYVLDAFNWQAHQDLLCPAYYTVGPVGQAGMIGAIEIGTNPGADYLQNVRFFPRCARLNADHTIRWETVGDSNQMIADRGYEMYDRVKLSCPSEDRVFTGIELRFEIGKGKIRDLRLRCHQLNFTYLP